jgi:hypothetical protein
MNDIILHSSHNDSFETFILNMKIQYFNFGINYFYDNNYPYYISKSNYFIIKNNFDELKEDSYPDNFMIYIYYLEDYTCKIVTIRQDINSGWDKDLKIKLFSINSYEEYEIISIGSHSNNIKICEFKTEIKLEKNLNYDTVINKDSIIQTSNTNNFLDYKNYLYFTNLIYTNHYFNYFFFDNIIQRKFIKYYFKERLKYFDLIKNNNIKNIFFICLYLYINGGVYCSTNLNLIGSLNSLDSNKNYYLIDNNMEIIFISINKKNNLILQYLEYLLLLDKQSIVLLFKTNFETFDQYFYEYNENENENENNYNIIERTIQNLNKNYILYNIHDNNFFFIFNYTIIINSEIQYDIYNLSMKYYIIKRFDNLEITEDIKIFYINENTDEKKSIIFKLDNKLDKSNEIERIHLPDNNYIILFRFT